MENKIILNKGILTDGIILDVDGTIWDTTSIISKAWNAAIKSLCFDVPAADSKTLKGEFGKTMSDIADDLWPSLSESEKAALMAACLKYEKDALSHLNTQDGLNARDICFNSVIDTVKKLCKRVPFFIVSNCQKGYIEMVMEKTGITDCIKDYECYGNTGNGKAANIKLLIKRNGLKSPIYVGDTLGDAVSCKEAGILFVWASYGFGHNVNAKYKIDIFADIAKLLDLEQ